MAQDMAVQFDIKKAQSIIKEGESDLLRYIDGVEADGNYLYFINEAGCYAWHCLKKEDMSLELDHGKTILRLKRTTIMPVVFNEAISNDISEALLKRISDAYCEVENESSEMPIVNSAGKIVAIAQVHKEDKLFCDWSESKEDLVPISERLFYISSLVGSRLNAFYKSMCNKINLHVLDAEAIEKIMSGNSTATLVYDTDIYPQNVKKISLDEFKEIIASVARYERNSQAMIGYKDCHLNVKKFKFPEEKNLIVESKMEEFLSQINSEKPIILVDCYDVEELAWMCGKLRTSEKYGGDNKLYLQYTDVEKLNVAIKLYDWREIIEMGKVVLFEERDKDRCYLNQICKNEKPLPLEMDEIEEIVYTFQRNYSGSDFFNMILDNHPNLLTIGWHGLKVFGAIYKYFCEGKLAYDVLNHMRNPKNELERNLLYRDLSDMLKYKHKKDFNSFFDQLSIILYENKQYEAVEWFKAFYLASNRVIGRTFKQRIAPAIFYDQHVGGCRDHIELGIAHGVLVNITQEIIDNFKYIRRIGVARHPLSRIGSASTFQVKIGDQGDPVWNSPLSCLKWFVHLRYGEYLSKSNKLYNWSRMFRFEDLKLYPRESTQELCKFLRIPWSETCLHITTNGEEAGIVDGTEGFDKTPVYKKHDEYLSTLDYYRLEMLNVKNFDIWGYKPKYYDGQKFSDEELKYLFMLPFKVDKMKIDVWPNWPDANEIQATHENMYKKMLSIIKDGECIPPKDNRGQSLELVKCCFPKLEKGQLLYEC